MPTTEKKERTKMNITKNRNIAIAIAIFLAFSMTASMMLIPQVHAATGTIPIFAYINAEPNPCGIGQSIEVIMWVQQIYGGNAELTNNYRFTNWTIIVTLPDQVNVTTNIGTIQSPTSDYNYFYTPTNTTGVGQYMFTFKFPATNVTEGRQNGMTYLAAQASTNVTVQSTTIPAYPQAPLPTAFWTRPIFGMNTNWFVLGSNWLGFGSPGWIANGAGPNLGGNGEEFGQQYLTSVGSLTSHVMWTLNIAPGGVVGNALTAESTTSNSYTTIPGNTYSDGSAYDQKFQNPIIVDGLLIFTLPISQTEPGSGATVCYNLVTGKLLWNESIGTIANAYVYDPEDPNQHGVWPPMLIAQGAFSFTTFTYASGSWYDAFTGDLLFTPTNFGGLGGTTMLGPAGENLYITLNNYGNTTNPNWYLVEWNSSRMWDNSYSGASTTPTLPPTYSNGASTVNNVATGRTIQYVCDDYNVSIPWLNTAKDALGKPIGSVTISGAIENDMLVFYTNSFPSLGQNSFFGADSWTPFEYFGLGINVTGITSPGMEPYYGVAPSGGTLGNELWANIIQPPPSNITVLWAGIDPVHNVFVLNYRETNQFVGYSLLTGKQIWGPSVEQPALDYYGSQASGSISDTIAYGNIYVVAYAGLLRCINTATGLTTWTFGNGPPGSSNSTNSGVNTPFGDYPTFVDAVGDGVIYTVTSEHTPETPLPPGSLERAINATTGQQIWTILGYTGQFLTGSEAIADGYTVFFNGYDNSVYCLGQGPSATTVTTQNAAIPLGSSIVIHGTVTDVSPGTTQTEQALDNPNGVPVCSDASMQAWMGYIYQQQPEPTTSFTGVPVQIYVLDSNGNHYIVGTATTDESGLYTLTYTPAIAGNFTVYAEFQGTNGYYSSSAETSFNVGPAPEQ